MGLRGSTSGISAPAIINIAVAAAASVPSSSTFSQALLEAALPIDVSRPIFFRVTSRRCKGYVV